MSPTRPADRFCSPPYCGPDAFIPGATGSVPSFQQVAAGAPASTTLATTKVDFDVLLNGVSIYDLAADATLATSASGALQFTSDFAQVSSVLTDFRRQYTSDTAFIDSYQWDSTDISLALPTLAAGRHGCGRLRHDRHHELERRVRREPRSRMPGVLRRLRRPYWSQ